MSETRTAARAKPATATGSLADFRFLIPQTPKEIARSENQEIANALTPADCPNVHDSQITVARSGKARSSLKISIQRPGLGSSLTSEGKAARARYGSSSPMPRLVKIRNE